MHHQQTTPATNNSSNRMHQLDALTRVMAVLNIGVGGIVFIVQLSTLSSLYDWVDWICIGLWGGSFMMSAGSLTFRRSPRLKSMAISALASSLALIIFYAWNLGELKQTYYCSHYNHSLCEWRESSDIILIVCGVLALFINGYLTAKAPSIMVALPAAYRINAYNAGGYPSTTAYVVTNSNTGYPTQQGFVYQVPMANQQSYQGGYPGNGGVVYQPDATFVYPPPNNNNNPPPYNPATQTTAVPTY